MGPVFFTLAAAAAAAPSPACPAVAPAYHAATTCGAGVSGVVRIPAVRKGLNNQRMRIVQDAVIAALLGAAVELPSVLRTRRRCGYRAGCYQDYEGTVPFDAVYDRERVVEGLRRAGVCVVDTRSEGRAPELAGALWPTTASQLGPGGDVARRYDLRGGVWSLGGEEDCCTKLVVDTRRSLDLLTSVNAAFSSARRIRRAAHEVSRRLAAATGNEHVAIHWRADEDFVRSAHGLDARAYARAACTALAGVARGRSSLKTLDVFVLGEADRARIRAIDADLRKHRSCPRFSLHAKATLGNVDEALASGPDGGDDVKGQVDFELGLRAAVFVGTQFSSFSALVALARRAEGRDSLMLDVDVADRLGLIFALTFPHDARRRTDAALSRLCRDVVAAHAAFGAGLAACLPPPRAGSSLAVHSFGHCEDCSHLMPSVCLDLDKADARHAAFVESTQIQAVVSRGFRRISCARVVQVVAERGVHRNPTTGEIYVVEDITDTGELISSLRAKLGNTPGDGARDGECSASLSFSSINPPLDAPAAAGGRRCTLAVVTALFGSIDSLEHLKTLKPKHARLLEFENRLGAASCWIALVDFAAARRIAAMHGARRCHSVDHGPWRVVRVPKALQPFATAAQNTRIPKMLAHRFVPNARYLLYFDAKLHPSTLEWTWRLLHDELLARGSAWTSPRHPARGTPHEEARCVHLLGLASDAALSQLRAYAAAGLPRDAPLAEGEWHLRDLYRNESSALGCAWFDEYRRWGHRRDQLAFPYASWTLRGPDEQEATATNAVFLAEADAGAQFRHIARLRRYERSRKNSALCALASRRHGDEVMAYIRRGGDRPSASSQARGVAGIAGAVEGLERAPRRRQARNLRLEDEVHRNADRDEHAGPRLRDERIERADVLFSVGPGLAEDPDHRD